MERCEHYTLDCEKEERGCEGCAYYKENEVKKEGDEQTSGDKN